MFKDKIEDLDNRIAKCHNDYYNANRELQIERNALKETIKNSVLNDFHKLFNGHTFTGYVSEYSFSAPRIYKLGMAINSVDGYCIDGATRRPFKLIQYVDATVAEYVETTISLDELDECAAELNEKYDFDIIISRSNYGNYLSKEDYDKRQTQKLNTALAIPPVETSFKIDWRSNDSLKDNLTSNIMNVLHTLDVKAYNWSRRPSGASWWQNNLYKLNDKKTYKWWSKF